jgi:hypothetical protein
VALVLAAALAFVNVIPAFKVRGFLLFLNSLPPYKPVRMRLQPTRDDQAKAALAV